MKSFIGKPTAVLTDEQIEIKIADFLLDNPSPTDLHFHAFASGIGVDKDQVEEVAYRMLSTLLRGAYNWDLLGRDPQEMQTALYMANSNVDSQVAELTDGHPKPSQNMVEVILRIRYKSAIDSITQTRQRTLSSSEDTLLTESDFETKLEDQVLINDQTRIATVNNELTNLGLDQTSIDDAIRYLELDGYNDVSNIVNSAYNSLREALIKNPNYVFDDPRFESIKTCFDRIRNDRRDLGATIRVTSARQVARIMRALTADYGVSNQGLFSSITR